MSYLTPIFIISIICIFIAVPAGEREYKKMLPLCDKYNGVMRDNITCYINTNKGVIPYKHLGSLEEFDYRNSLFPKK